MINYQQQQYKHYLKEMIQLFTEVLDYYFNKDN